MNGELYWFTSILNQNVEYRLRLIGIPSFIPHRIQLACISPDVCNVTRNFPRFDIILVISVSLDEYPDTYKSWTSFSCHRRYKVRWSSFKFLKWKLIIVVETFLHKLQSNTQKPLLIYWFASCVKLEFIWSRYSQFCKLLLSCWNIYLLSMEPWAAAKKNFYLVWRCHQLLSSGFLAKGHLPWVSRQSRRSLMIRVTMKWSWGLCTDLLAFALQLRKTSAKRPSNEGTSHRLKWGPFSSKWGL